MSATNYPVNEIFYSLQGEGFFTGTPATFIRLSGCNLSCPFCDTRHHAHRAMSIDDIVTAVTRNPSRHVVITGGEPTIHDLTPLVDALHSRDCYIQLETNGTSTAPDNIDWVTCSPKDRPVKLARANEIKLLYLPRFLEGNDTPDVTLRRLVGPSVCLNARLSLQPCDLNEPYTNSRILDATIDYIKRHPHWHLSLQTHKLISIP